MSTAATIDRLSELLAAPLQPGDLEWITGPHGLIAACREAVALGELDALGELELDGDALDDQALALSGPRPSERAAALLAAARLARWSTEDRRDAAALLTVVANAWRAPGAGLRTYDPVSTAVDPMAMIDALVAASGTADDVGLAVARDLVAHLAGTDRTEAPAISVPVLVSRHADGDLARFTVIEAAPGAPAVLAPDALAGPFTRVDETFEQALQAAWAASGASRGARWSLQSVRTGRPFSVVTGPSIGLGAAMALERLARRGAPPIPPDWTFTGAIAASGATASLLGPQRELAEYHAKVRAAERRTMVVPAVDQPHLAGYVEAVGAEVRLIGVADLAEADRLAARHRAGEASYARAVARGRLRPRRVAVATAALVGIAAIAAALWWSLGRGESDPAITRARGDEMEVAGRGQISPFRMGLTEVTNGQYRLCVEAQRCQRPFIGLEAPGSPFDNPANDAFPVTGVSAADARNFCEWIGRELPSLEQWQLAAQSRARREWPLSVLANEVVDFPRGDEPGGSPSAVAVARDPRTAPSDDPSAVEPSYLVRNVREWTREVCAAGDLGACRDWDGTDPEKASMRVVGLSFNVSQVRPADTRWWTDGRRQPARLGAVDIGFRCVTRRR